MKFDFLEAPVRRSLRWCFRHVPGTFQTCERLQQRLLGLGRGGRRHGKSYKGARFAYIPLSRQRGPLQDANAQEGEG